MSKFQKSEQNDYSHIYLNAKGELTQDSLIHLHYEDIKNNFSSTWCDSETDDTYTSDDIRDVTCQKCIGSYY